MLSNNVSNESKSNSKASLYSCQVKSKPVLDREGIFDRILKALEAKNAPEAARILGLSKQAVYDWQKNTPGIENLMKISESSNTSLHWLLTGQGERAVDRPKKILSVEIVLEEKIRSIVREELRWAAAQQNLGTIDEFDLAESLRKHDNPAIVLREWYRHEGLPIEDISVPVFKGWDEMTVEEKAEELRVFRRLDKKRKELRRNVLPPKAA